jgi:hypothetical protein
MARVQLAISGGGIVRLGASLTPALLAEVV